MYVINGRAWPDTIAPNGDPWTDTDRLRYQPNSSLVQGNSGETVLLRLANLGFRSHALQLDGLTMRVVGQDAKPLGASRPDYLSGGPRGDISFATGNLDIAAGRSFDVLVQLPSVAAVTDFPLYDRSVMTPRGDGAAGGMRTLVRVYPASTLGAQTTANELLGPDA
jgi:FtsP/CotA-like multicopper oxidase with cupredoxin domain